MVGGVCQKVETLAYPGTIFSPDRQFSLRSDHPALSDTNVQLQSKCQPQESCAQPLLLWIAFRTRWHRSLAEHSPHGSTVGIRGYLQEAGVPLNS